MDFVSGRYFSSAAYSEISIIHCVSCYVIPCSELLLRGTRFG